MTAPQQPPNIAMRPEGVKVTARQLTERAAAAHLHIRTLFASSATAARGNPQWDSARELTACRVAWEAEFDRLITRTRMLGEDIRAAAELVCTLDHEGETRMYQVLRGLAK